MHEAIFSMNVRLLIGPQNMFLLSRRKGTAGDLQMTKFVTRGGYTPIVRNGKEMTPIFEIVSLTGSLLYAINQPD